jgi:hypothetical protein
MCDPAGCLSELFIQLSIIMVGKQFFNNFMEILAPYVCQPTLLLCAVFMETDMLMEKTILYFMPENFRIGVVE